MKSGTCTGMVAAATGAFALTVLLSGAPASCASPPPPEEFLGFDPVAEARAVGPEEVAGYIRALAAATRRVRVEAIGLTTEGRPLEMAVVSSPENLGPDVRQGGPGSRPIPVLITCSLHSDEVGPALMALRLLHRLVSGRTDGAERILRELVLLVFPAANPDGLALVREAAGETRGWPGPLPALYQRYAGHDNNRDWLLLTQAETRAFARLYASWRPLLAIDVHQMGRYGPRLFLPPYAPPVNPLIPPRLLRHVDLLGKEVRERLSRAGKSGIASAAGFDVWTPARAYPFFHGAPRLLIEVAGAEFFRAVEISRPRRTWGIPEIVDYSLAAVEAALQAVSEDPDGWRDADGPGGGRESPGTDSSRSGRFIPADRGDPWAAREVLEALRLGGVEVVRSRGGFTVAAPREGPEGIEGWIRSLLECTPYPRGPWDAAPYDGTCHDLAHLAGLEVRRVPLEEGSEAEEAPLAPFPGAVLPGGAPGAFLIETRSLAVLREAMDLILEGHDVRRTRMDAEAGGRRFPAGSLFVAGAPAPWIERIARETGADACAAPAPPPPADRLRRPRVGVLAAGGPSIDEGWTRWTLEEFRIPFRSVRDLVAGLRDIDVLVAAEETLPGRGREAAGAGDREALEAFVAGGGRLVALGTSARKIAAWMDLPLTDLKEAGAGAAALRAGGVLLRARPSPAGKDHPLLQGVGPEAALYFTDGPYWSFPSREGAGSAVRGILEFPPGGTLLCGALSGGEPPAGAFPLVEARKGRGEVLLFGFRPQFRGWTLSSLRILLNAVLREERR